VNIFFEWPTSYRSVALHRNIEMDEGVIFEVSNGSFMTRDFHSGQDAVLFYWHFGKLMIVNLCQHSMCHINDREIFYGEEKLVRDQSLVVVGHFKLRFISNDNDKKTLAQLIDPGIDLKPSDNEADLEGILPQRGSYIGDFRNFNSVEMLKKNEEEELKRLEAEYKNYIMRQEQYGCYADGMVNDADYIIKQDQRFDELMENIEGKTLTESIINKEFLMEKVWEEMDNEEIDESIFNEEGKIDLLVALSPQHIVRKKEKILPEIIFKDFDKKGLHTYY